MWSNPSDSNDEQPPPYSAVAPQANQPERRIIPSSNANVWMSDLPPRYEHPPTYSRISQPYRPLLPRDEASNLPRFAARSERPNPLHGVTRVLASIQMAEKETFNAQVNNIAALWAVDTGHGQPVPSACSHSGVSLARSSAPPSGRMWIRVGRTRVRCSTPPVLG
jgi:hypothetical protein